MSRTSYYYDPPGSLTLINKPGEVCNGCGELARIQPAGSMVPMPCDASMEEYGHSTGDIHMHLECAKSIAEEYDRLAKEAHAAIVRFEQDRK